MELKKHVGAIHCSGKLSLLQRKISNILLFNAYEELGKKEEHEISIKRLCELIDYGSNDYKTIKDALRQLLVIVLEWNILHENLPDEEEWNASTILADVGIKGAVCTYSYSPKMRKLLHSPTMYGCINVAVQSRFTSNYSLALYETCARYKNLQYTKWFEVAIFRQLMGIEEGSYKAFSQFKRRIIDKAVEEINSFSDINIEPEFKKQSHWIVAIRFKINSRKLLKGREGEPDTLAANQSSSSIIDNQPQTLVNKILETDFGLDTKQINLIKKEHTEEYIQQKIDLVKLSPSYMSGKIQNLAAYLLSALKNDYKIPILNKVADKRPNVFIKETKSIDNDELKKEYSKLIASNIEVFVDRMNDEERINLIHSFENYLISLPATLRLYKGYQESGLKNKRVLAEFQNFVRKSYAEIDKQLVSYQDFISCLGAEQEPTA